MQISSFWSVKMPTKIKKSHTCEGGAHLKISVWHLLMNLKTNSSLLPTLKPQKIRILKK